ncbi:reverse transcriptase domain-containing protein [Tanacetum coccineum]
MSVMANTTPIVTTVTKPATKEKTLKDADAIPRVNIQDFCEEHYENILPVIMDRMRRDKRKEVHARLDFEEIPKKRKIREGSQNSSARTLSARHHNPSERQKVQDRLRSNDRHVLDRLGHRRQSAFNRLSDTYSPNTTKSRPDRVNSRDHSQGRSRPHRRDSSNKGHPRSRDGSRGVEESYDNSRSSYGTGTNHGYRSHDKDHSYYEKIGREWESLLPRVSESGTSGVGHWKSKSKRHKPADEDDCPGYTYDGTGDPEDHVKKFQAAAQVERWAMPTWCHMFNSTLIGAARVWFDELPPESIDGYKDLKAAFLVYFMQQKKHVKDPVEIHNIKQRDGETIEDFMERFKVETGRMKRAPKCMRISGFMHGVNNPELTKRLNEHVSKTMEEMMIATAAFIRGEAVAAGKKKGHAPWKAYDQSKRHALEWRMTRQKVTQSFERVREITFPSLATSSGTEGPLVIEVEIGGHMIHRMYVDGGSSTEWRNYMATGTTSTLGNNRRHIPFYKIMDELHDRKFPANEGIVTIRSTILIPAECAAAITSSKEMPKGVEAHHENLKVALHPNFPDQEVAIRGMLSAEGRTKLCSLLKKNLDIFAWQPSDMTGVSRSIVEHRLNIREGYSLVRQKKRGQAQSGRKLSKQRYRN